MNYLKYGSTTILADDGVDDWMINLVTQCLDFNAKMSNTKLILLKRSLGENNIIGLTVDAMDGFILFLDSMDTIVDKHEKLGVAPIATKTHLIVDTVFHEMHHVESYHEDSDWVTKHVAEEEKNANEVAKSLDIEFFKTVRLDLPVEGIPYIFKSGLTLVADLREYFNILLDGDAEWDALPLPLSTWATDLVDEIVSVESDIGKQQTVVAPPVVLPVPMSMAQTAKALYNECFDKIFNGCTPSANGFTAPEKILETISTRGIVASASMMNPSGIVKETPVVGLFSGLVFKTSKLPAYEFTLVDGKKRVIVPQNPNKKDANGAFTATAIRAQAGEKIGYIIDKATNKFIIRYENGNFIPC